MTLREFRERLKGSRIKPDTELVLHVEDGDFPVSTLEYDKAGKKLKVCTDEWQKKSLYRVMYEVVKDHSEIVVASEYGVHAATDEELTFQLDELKDKILARHGVEGEKNEKSQSIAMEVPDHDYVAEGGHVVVKHVKRKHYFSCRISEILKVVDEENDVYMRVWYDGNSR